MEEDWSSPSLPSERAESAGSPVNQDLPMPLPCSCTSNLQDCEKQLLVAVPGFLELAKVLKLMIPTSHTDNVHYVKWQW